MRENLDKNEEMIMPEEGRVKEKSSLPVIMIIVVLVVLVVLVGLAVWGYVAFVSSAEDTVDTNTNDNQSEEVAETDALEPRTEAEHEMAIESIKEQIDEPMRDREEHQENIGSLGIDEESVLSEEDHANKIKTLKDNL